MKHATLGVELAGILVVLIGLGWWVDQKYDTSPWFLLFGAAFALIGCMSKIWLIWRNQYIDRD
jgi:F0F1-type ATP synthase assembly protein I